jgi:hypothetical protein
LQQRRLRFSLTLTFSSTVEIFRHQLEIVRGSVEKKRTQFTCDAKFRFAANSIHFDADYHFTFTSPLSFMNANSNFALKTIRASPQSFVSSPPNARKKGRHLLSPQSLAKPLRHQFSRRCAATKVHGSFTIANYRFALITIRASRFFADKGQNKNRG